MAEKYFLGTDSSERFPLWTRANVGEVFPDPVAMSSFDFAFANADGVRMAEMGWRDSYIKIGAFTEDEFDPDDCFEGFGDVHAFGIGAGAQLSCQKIFGWLQKALP